MNVVRMSTLEYSTFHLPVVCPLRYIQIMQKVSPKGNSATSCGYRRLDLFHGRVRGYLNPMFNIVHQARQVDCWVSDNHNAAMLLTLSILNCLFSQHHGTPSADDTVYQSYKNISIWILTLCTGSSECW